MNKPVKTAITSFGLSGQAFHGPFLKINPRFEVLQILERSKNLSAGLFPSAEIVRDFNSIINNPEIELVIINTPDIFHFEMAKAAILGGKHIIVEKPVTLRSCEAEELLELSEKTGVVFTVFHNRRWDGDFLTLKKIIEQGMLGRLVEFESHYDRYRPLITPDTWKEAGDEYAGVLYNLGTHMVDQALVLFGKPEAVTAHLKIRRKNGVVTDYYDIRLEYGDFSASLKCSYLVMNNRLRYILHGENGSFFKYGIDPQEDLCRAGYLPDSENWGKESEENWGLIEYSENNKYFKERIETIPGDYSIFYNNVYDAIRNGIELLVNPRQAIDGLKILEACLESNRLKKTITL